MPPLRHDAAVLAIYATCRATYAYYAAGVTEYRHTDTLTIVACMLLIRRFAYALYAIRYGYAMRAVFCCRYYELRFAAYFLSAAACHAAMLLLCFVC